MVYGQHEVVIWNGKENGAFCGAGLAVLVLIVVIKHKETNTSSTLLRDEHAASRTGVSLRKSKLVCAKRNPRRKLK